jgi:bis(5'-adenosyl)-triphosphatase
MNKQPDPLETCPFCSPENQRIAFASSESFIALYNIAPVLPGHSLIIPRMHVKSLRSLSEELICELFLFARQVTDVLLDFYEADAFDWSLQDNDSAGQTIPHLHLHIIVRHHSDLPEPGDWYQLLNSQKSIDNVGRPRLDITEYSLLTDRLKAAFLRITKK